MYLTKEQAREKIRGGQDIDPDRVYVIDDPNSSDYEDPYEYMEDGIYNDDDDDDV